MGLKIKKMYCLIQGLNPQQLGNQKVDEFSTKALHTTGLFTEASYSHLSNRQGGINMEGTKVAKSLNVEGGIIWKKLVHNRNKRGVEGEKKSINMEVGNEHGGWNFFSKSVSVTSRLLER